MKKGQHSIPAVLRNIVCAALALWVLMASPTGWLYDLWAGVGTEQGQRPGAVSYTHLTLPTNSRV